MGVLLASPGPLIPTDVVLVGSPLGLGVFISLVLAIIGEGSPRVTIGLPPISLPGILEDRVKGDVDSTSFTIPPVAYPFRGLYMFEPALGIRGLVR